MVKNFSSKIQETTFTSDVFLILLGCFNLVLGVEWLVILGDITWNFNKLIMKFRGHGKKHVLRGASAQNVKNAKKQHLLKALEGGVHFYMLQLCHHSEGLMQSLTV